MTHNFFYDSWYYILEKDKEIAESKSVKIVP